MYYSYLYNHYLMPCVKNSVEDGNKKGTVSNGTGVSRRTKSTPSQPKSVQSSISKARDEARKRMLAERRKEMRKNTNTNEDVVIV